MFSALWLVLISQTVSPSPLKNFIQADNIREATEPFAGKYLYVDKTHLAQKLCENHRGCYFFVRPKRFGKSTFLATLQRIMDGSKGIFNGTEIHRSNYTWKRFPVLYSDLGRLVIEHNCDNVIETNITLLESTLLEKH